MSDPILEIKQFIITRGLPWLKKPWVKVGLGVIFLLGLLFLTGLVDPLRGLLSITKIDPQPVYSMTFYGDYHFKDYLKTGIDVSRESKQQQNPAWGCTGFAALNPGGQPIFGRNFDWDNDPILILKTDSPDGYAAISLVDARYLGLDRENFSTESRLKLLDAPYLPFDGMNEMGLAVGMMAVPVEPPHDPNKLTIGSLQAIRLMLDYAKNVDEAVALISQYNIDFSGGPGIHYLVADRAGKSVVIEFTNQRMNVIPAEGHWQAATNFIMTGKTLEEGQRSCRRYDAATRKLQERDGQLSLTEAANLLKETAQPSTLWSVIYNLQTGQAQISIRGKFETSYPFTIKTNP